VQPRHFEKAIAMVLFHRYALGLCGVLACVASAGADELALAKAKNCLECHAVDQAVVGPAFKDIGAQYAGKPGMVDKLAHTIIHGGPTDQMDVMPANPEVSEAEARQLATWILGLK
jgi:cytochrome c